MGMTNGRDRRTARPTRKSARANKGVEIRLDVLMEGLGISDIRLRFKVSRRVNAILRSSILHIALNERGNTSSSAEKYGLPDARRGVFWPCRKQALAMDIRNAIVQKIVGSRSGRRSIPKDRFK
jgi:hypothetical protein